MTEISNDLQPTILSDKTIIIQYILIVELERFGNEATILTKFHDTKK